MPALLLAQVPSHGALHNLDVAHSVDAARGGNRLHRALLGALVPAVMLWGCSPARPCLCSPPALDRCCCWTRTGCSQPP